MNHYEICHSTGYLGMVAKMLGEEFDPSSLSDRDAFITNEHISDLVLNLAKAHDLQLAASSAEQLRAALRLGHEDGKIYKVPKFLYGESPKTLKEVDTMYIELDGWMIVPAIGDVSHVYSGIYVDTTKTSFFNKDSKDTCLSVIFVTQNKVKERSRDDIYNVLIPILGSTEESINVACEKNYEYMKAVLGREYTEKEKEVVKDLILTAVKLIDAVSRNKFVRVKATVEYSIAEKLNVVKNKKKQRRMIRELMKGDFFDKWAPDVVIHNGDYFDGQKLESKDA